MTKFIRSLACLSALAVMVAATGSTAQDKKKDDKKPAETKKDEKKADDKKEAGIHIYKNDNGKWRYRIVNADGKTIVMPVPLASWETKADCEKAIADLKALLNAAKPTEVKD